MSFPAASASPSADELTTTLLSQATRDRVAEYTRGMIQGVTAPSSVLVVAFAGGSGLSPALADAWHAVFSQDHFKESLHTLIQEAGIHTAQSLGKRVLPRAELDLVLAGDAATPVADDQFGLVVNHWKQGEVSSLSTLAISPFEITLSVLSKKELENHRQFTQEANAVASRLALKRASSPQNSKSPIPSPKL